MGEEQKEEEKKEEEKKEEPPPPEEIILRVYMHCEGCARKVARSLRGFEGVEDVMTDSKTHRVVVKGKTADPVKVCERIQKKTGRKTEILSPLPKPPLEEEKKEEPKEEKKEEPPQPITVVLKVRMHCEACAQVLQKRIKKMEGVESVVTDVPNGQVIVKGFVDPAALVEKVHRRTRKHASVVKDEEKKEEEKKAEEGEKKKEKAEEEAKKEEEGKGDGEEEKKEELKKMEYWPPKYHMDQYAYSPQLFSDENPNSCSVM
ncbi:Heavy metal-associated isoprenylated plant protein 26 [Acorus gramineus]|uniref:Heavy metal-associated isoprenylated plant protein 26 n=1 Tax=Acorus gramineus TaxID=55184 RepID=A0AAV9BCL6_ACOGR|nr:Heavy metal-associated isoprenylated plant protein 26 [Acorus gramineus]